MSNSRAQLQLAVDRSVPPRKQLDYLIERRRFDEARQVLGKMLAERPEDLGLLYYGAFVDYYQERHERALETVETILGLHPDHLHARMLLFYIHQAERRFRDAEEVVVNLIDDCPDDAGLHAQYSILMLETMRLKKAEQLADQALRLAPDDEQALLACALCAFVAEPSPEANHRLQELVRRCTNSLSTLRATAVVLANSGHDREALLVSKELLRAYPDNEGLVNMVVGLKVRNHWSIRPMAPMLRFTRDGSAGFWVLVVAFLALMPAGPLVPWRGPILIGVLIYVVYSWVYPLILDLLMRR